MYSQTHSSRHKRPTAEAETHLSREQLQELRQVPNERAQAGQKKLFGMYIKGTMGVHSVVVASEAREHSTLGQGASHFGTGDSESNVSITPDSDSSRERRRRKRRDKEERRKEKKEKKKEKRERKGKKKHKGKTGAVTGQWGQYGIINESHMYEKDAFARFIEGYNLATLPHPKFYNMASYERQMNSLRNGMTADAHSSRHKRLTSEAETHLSREQLQELRQVQNERAQAGQMKLLGMDIKGTIGVHGGCIVASNLLPRHFGEASQLWAGRGEGLETPQLAKSTS
ncbi:unnamed protein product [Rhizoctonia solani]|uniref:Uncharacterized protein n=1 Tax=Rhizoctonia solani TaxID=456999 RepID=A0A8H3CSV8_9AGAM|nr:unnamed protein product [Rhizoctonia solani]